MNMQARPILSALRRHKLVIGLLILEIALTCAIVCNSVFIISQRLERVQMPSGIAEHELALVRMAYISDRPDATTRAQTDLAALRQIGGVRQVALVDAVPFSTDGPNDSVKLDPQQQRPSLSVGAYFGRSLLPTLGVGLIAGRGFQPDEFVDASQVTTATQKGDFNELPHVVLITQAMAQRLWPGQSALGKTLYLGRNIGLQVVGVLARLTRSGALSRGADYSMVMPVSVNLNQGAVFVIRCAPQDRARVLRAAAAKLKQLDPNRVLLQQVTFDQFRADYFQSDRAMARLLVGVCLALLIVTALGIVGLASFWVAQRRKQIGIRRAMGATRGDILRYFQSENFLIVSFGIALGMVLAFAINTTLMRFYELGRLPFFYLPIGAVVLWCLGQIAILGPALRASNVPPVVATRSV
ncbi:MAG TPA: FtsX-like permease family protein [Steroidobacteraceae bacterium]|jgi:putative ABC transport system permease protein|nr:FtsX-like permease family protein [Steroidobacteraceae bacterium]